MAGNNDGTNTAGSPAPEECWAGGFEPLALFEINIGAAFSPPTIYFRGVVTGRSLYSHSKPPKRNNTHTGFSAESRGSNTCSGYWLYCFRHPA